MFVIHAPKNTNPCERIILGHVGENMARCVVFDLKEYVEEFGAGSFTIANQRQGDALPYIVTNTALVGNTNATWYLTDVDTAVEGFGICQLRYYVDNVLCKTDTYQTRVLKSVGITGDVPDPYKDLLEDVELVVENLPLIQSVPTLAQDAADSADEAEDFANQAAASALSIDPDDFLAPSAAQMLSDKGETDTAPYLFRRSGGNGADRRFDELIGSSVAWNQLVGNGNFESTSGWSTNSATSFSVADNVASFTATAQNGRIQKNVGVTTIAGHVYFSTSEVKATVGTVIQFYGVNSSAGKEATMTGQFQTLAVISVAEQSQSVTYFPRVMDRRATGFDAVQVRNVMVFDITQMFGSAIADYAYTLEQNDVGSGIAWLKSYGFFTAPYYAYNTGAMLSVKTTAAETVGFNAWDEEWEQGGISTSDGTNSPSTNRIRSKNYNPCIPGQTYYLECGSAGTNIYYLAIVWYDADKDFISAIYKANSYTNAPSNAAYFKITTNGSSGSDYGGTYLNDICINLSGTRNGEYEPYIKRTYPLDDVELRGIPKLDASNQLYYDGDVYASDGTVTRRFAEDSIGYGSYAATSMPYSGVFLFSFSRKYGNGNFNIICSKYPTYTAGHSTGANIQTLAAAHDKCVFLNAGSTTIYIADSSYSSLSDFNTSLVTENASIVYEAFSITTESSDPFQAPMILYPDGTERFVDERTVPMPVGHSTFYPVNQRAKLDGLPSDFSTLIAPTEKTNTASQNYAVGSYLIMANQLYKVTSAITTGQTITPNTNVTATTVMAEIMALA